MKREYTKNCPECREPQTYTRKYKLKLAIKNDIKCKNCYEKRRPIFTEEEKIKKKKIANKEYHKRNKDQIKKQKKEYRQKIEAKEKERDRKNKQRKNPVARLNNNISTCIRQSLKTKNLSKAGRHWEDLVGYSVQDLKEYIESLFQPGMNWNNRGDWHIDHIIPVSFFQYTSTDDVEFKYCWSLNNLQPLWAEENLSKGNKVLQRYKKPP